VPTVLAAQIRVSANAYPTTGGFDGPIHISEEVSNARTAVPWAVITSIGIAGVLGWGSSSRATPPVRLSADTLQRTVINLVLAFNMGTDTESIVASPIGQPMATVSLAYSRRTAEM
jgi:amino acid transporter